MQLLTNTFFNNIVKNYIFYFLYFFPGHFPDTHYYNLFFAQKDNYFPIRTFKTIAISK